MIYPKMIESLFIEIGLITFDIQIRSKLIYNNFTACFIYLVIVGKKHTGRKLKKQQKLNQMLNLLLGPKKVNFSLSPKKVNFSIRFLYIFYILR